MSTHILGEYTIYLRSNKVTVISNSRRFFQKEILPKDLYQCESKEDVFNILNKLFEADNIMIRDNNSGNSISLSFYIKNDIKEKLIIVYLPEIENDKLPFDYSLMKVETEIYEIKLCAIILMILILLNIVTSLLL